MRKLTQRAKYMFDYYKKKRRACFGLYICLILAFSYSSLLYAIPDEMYVTEGEEFHIQAGIPMSITQEEEQEVFGNESRKVLGDSGTSYQVSCRLFGIFPVKTVEVSVIDSKRVVPCGVPVGIYLKTEGVLVLGTGDVTGADGTNISPSEHAVKSGDYIQAVNGVSIETKEELVEQIDASGGQEMTLTLKRDGENLDVKVQPIRDQGNHFRLGIWVRDDLAGIGTLTYVTEQGSYGALGHAVSDVDTGEQVVLAFGNLYEAQITNIVKGEKGQPGELAGTIQYTEDNLLGSIDENTEIGIYGSLEHIPEEISEDAPVEVCLKQNVVVGPAQILCTVDGEQQAYDIEIQNLDYNSREKNKGIQFVVTDEELLDKTGGVIQGMSGSPILQDGRIVGAVTHVFVNSPDKGYGIFVEEMLEH